MKYRIVQDINSDEEVIVFETNDFISALKKARKMAIQKVDRFFVYSNIPNSDMCISYDPLGKEVIL